MIQFFIGFIYGAIMGICVMVIFIDKEKKDGK